MILLKVISIFLIGDGSSCSFLNVRLMQPYTILDNDFAIYWIKDWLEYVKPPMVLDDGRYTALMCSLRPPFPLSYSWKLLPTDGYQKFFRPASHPWA